MNTMTTTAKTKTGQTFTIEYTVDANGRTAATICGVSCELSSSFVTINRAAAVACGLNMPSHITEAKIMLSENISEAISAAAAIAYETEPVKIMTNDSFYDIVEGIAIGGAVRIDHDTICMARTALRNTGSTHFENMADFMSAAK